MARVAPYRSCRNGDAISTSPAWTGASSPTSQSRRPIDEVAGRRPRQRPPADELGDQPVGGRHREPGAGGELGQGQPPVVLVESADQGQRPAGDRGAGGGGVAGHPASFHSVGSCRARRASLAGPYRRSVTNLLSSSTRRSRPRPRSTPRWPRSRPLRWTGEPQPRLDYPPYRSSLLRHPTKDLHPADPEGIELWAPVFGERDVDPVEADLTVQHPGEPIGERMKVTGRVLDGDGRPVRHQLVEIWQANAGGRYIHERDQHPAPIDPNFTGVGPLPDRRRRHATRSPRSSPAPTRGATTATPGGRRTSTSRCSARSSPSGW